MKQIPLPLFDLKHYQWASEKDKGYVLRQTTEWRDASYDDEKAYLPWNVTWKRFMLSVSVSDESELRKKALYVRVADKEPGRIQCQEDWDTLMIDFANAMATTFSLQDIPNPRIIAIGSLGYVMDEVRLAYWKASLPKSTEQDLEVETEVIDVSDGDNVARDDDSAAQEISHVPPSQGERQLGTDYDGRDESSELTNLLSEDGKYKRDEEQRWHRACELFGKDPSEINTGVKLQWMTATLENYQMLDTYRILEVCIHNDRNGTFNASKVGLGKSLETLTAASVIAVAHICSIHVKSNPNMHRGITSTQGCPNPYGFGLRCCCEADSMTQKIADYVQVAPQLLITPARLRDQWMEEHDKHFEAQFRFNIGIDMEEPVLIFAQFNDGQFKSYANERQRTNLKANNLIPSFNITGELPRNEGLKSRYSNQPSRMLESGAFNYTYDFQHLFRTGGEDGLKASMIESDNELAEGNEEIVLSRVVYYCSSNTFSTANAISDPFLVQREVRQQNRKTKRHIKIRGCFCPSSIYYDEFNEAKDQNSQLVQNLTKLCMLSESAHGTKPVLSFLSGTPMPNGPDDLQGLLPLILTKPIGEVKQDLAELSALFKEAFASDFDADGQVNSPHDLELVRKAQDRLRELARDHMIFRDYNMNFLGTRIPDPRPPPRRHPPEFPPDSAAVQKTLAALRVQVRSEIQQVRQEAEARLKASKANKGRQSRGRRSQAQSASSTSGVLSVEHMSMTCKSFWYFRQCAVLPGLANIDHALLRQISENLRTGKAGDTPSGSATPTPGRSRRGQRNVAETNIGLSTSEFAKIDCEQLQLIKGYVCQSYSDGQRRHGLILAISPLVAAVIAVWLEIKLREKVKIVHVQSNFGDPAKRTQLVRENNPLGEEGKERQKGWNDKHVVTVSTFDLMSAGIDGCQMYMSYVVKVGEPFGSERSSQAVGRVYRKGQKRNVDIYAVHGARKSLDWELYHRHRNNRSILGEDSIFGWPGVQSQNLNQSSNIVDLTSD